MDSDSEVKYWLSDEAREIFGEKRSSGITERIASIPGERESNNFNLPLLNTSFLTDFQSSHHSDFDKFTYYNLTYLNSISSRSEDQIAPMPRGSINKLIKQKHRKKIFEEMFHCHRLKQNLKKKLLWKLLTYEVISSYNATATVRASLMVL